MNKSTIQTLIDKVIGKKGLIRVPSWWMRKVLMQMADWVQEGDDANGEKIVKVKEEADGKIGTLETNVNTLETNLNSEISYLKNLSLPYMLVSGTGSVLINKEVINFSNANNQLIYITGPIKFSRSNIADNEQITSIVIHNLDVRVQGNNMASIFGRCKNLSSINIRGLYTSAVTSMTHMFESDSSLTSLDLTGFDTSAVTNMSSMFSNCSGLTSLDLTGFDTSSVTSMNSMFSTCSSLTSLDLSSFNTSLVTSMWRMFSGCVSLTSLDLSSFDTSSVRNMDEMFNNCSSLTSLDLSSFDTSSVTNMEEIFSNCQKLTSLDLSSFDTSSVRNMTYMFFRCQGLTSLILGPNFFKTSKVTSVDFSDSSQWTNDTVVTSLVTNSYDRATAGLSTMTLQLSANTKAALTDEQKAAITAKGYTIA